jgi:uncharacterized membrane protein
MKRSEIQAHHDMAAHAATAVGMTRDDAMSIMDAALVIAACTLALAGIASFVYVLHLIARIT